MPDRHASGCSETELDALQFWSEGVAPAGKKWRETFLSDAHGWGNYAENENFLDDSIPGESAFDDEGGWW